jgi:2-haloacid dehalogenase
VRLACDGHGSGCQASLSGTSIGALAGVALPCWYRSGAPRMPGVGLSSPVGAHGAERRGSMTVATSMTAEALKAKVKVCMFDQYGTVVDMQKGLTEAAAPYLKGKGWNGRADAFVTWWRRTHFENSMIDALLHREHTPYREIGHRALAYTLERAGIAHTMDEVRSMVAQIERLKPFPDVPEALARMKTRYKIVVLSNGDPDMLEAAKAFHGIPFDAVISVAVAGSFKPHVATYTKAAELVGVGMDEVLFVANHAFDCIGAKSAGMHSAFIDRRERPFGGTPHQPDIVARDMKGLADMIV